MGPIALVWHSFQLKGYEVPRQVVELLLRELDPDGCQLSKRKIHNLKRRQYHNPGPNAKCRQYHNPGHNVSIITQVQMSSGTPIGTTNLNPMVFQFMIALTAEEENCYGW